MSDADDYLQEGFDPRNVTVPRLRSILVTHNVDYPTTAKKPQLVQLVFDHVLPQVPKLRAQRDRAKRSSLGIVNAGSAEDTGTWDDYDLAPPSTVKRRSHSPRKSSARVKVEEEEIAATPFRSPKKRTARSVSRQLSHDVDDTPQYEAPKSARRMRRTVTPQIKAEPASSSSSSDEDDDEHEKSVFTDDNPFQGGTSPPPVRTPGYRRRTGTEDFLQSERTPRRISDRASEGIFDQPHNAKSYGLSVPKTRHKTPEFLVEPGEEFTPEAQLELEEAASRGEVTVAPRKAPSTVRKTSLKTPFFVLFVSLLGVYLAWYRQEKIAVGYCGLGRPAMEIIPPEIPVPDFLLPFVEPQCEDCPPHAYCYENFAVRCESDFLLRPHPLSLGGLVPLPPTCEPDGEKARRVQAVADKAIEELRDRRAKFECGELLDDAGQQENTPAMAEEELKKTVSKKRNKRLSSEEFEELWESAIGDITKRDEVVVEVETRTP